MIKLEWSEEFCTITFDRPHKRNALTSDMYRTMTKALQDAAASLTIKAVIFRHEGDFFCAGHDLEGFLQHDFDESHPLILFLKELIKCPKYMFAALEGPAIGIGATLLCHCDFVIARETVTLQTPFVHLGVCPEAASSQLFERIFGRNIARQMLLLGREIKITDIADRLATEICTDDNHFFSALERLVTEIKSLPLHSLLVAKDLMRDFDDNLERIIERENKTFKALLATEETQAIIREKLISISKKNTR